MIQILLDLPIWMLIRVFGILSYLSLFVGMALGIAYSFPQWKGQTKARLLRSHTYANHLGTCLALLHTVLLVIDTFMPYDWKEILVPFAAKHSAVLSGTGSIALYGLLLLIFTTDIRQKLKKKLWFAFHLLSYPIFVLALIHGVFIGTDSSNILIKTMYVTTALLLIGLTVLRAVVRPRKQAARAKETYSV
ncbi:ferric reductase-like transmembrane domain-containing protein [Paenibacillus sp. CGMCC 1.16610]|uniref:Ferric reductase n=1 Tax=Paenibacillus anseongense TaxID=2682845 RepID=A0ABW9UGW1_9BACL|nr:MULTISPECIES: ferric reductase-like transmembrane domain-containing protein [Paenibacillus]MBA2944059.1 ferric reductase-like transmembrane domain-containing protein [Paenibacillus sp. CGMCC 1.16610]MVQ37948.1 ferric reductase [Paenibacillus anseongense]